MRHSQRLVDAIVDVTIRGTSPTERADVAGLKSIPKQIAERADARPGVEHCGDAARGMIAHEKPAELPAGPDGIAVDGTGQADLPIITMLVRAVSTLAQVPP